MPAWLRGSRSCRAAIPACHCCSAAPRCWSSRWRWRSGSHDGGAPSPPLRPGRGTPKTGAPPPHFPPSADGQLLVADATILPATGIEGMLAGLHEAELEPAAVWLVGEGPRPLEAGNDPLPVIAGTGSGA